jgi:hypothetical protein
MEREDRKEKVVLSLVPYGKVQQGEAEQTNACMQIAFPCLAPK